VLSPTPPEKESRRSERGREHEKERARSHPSIWGSLFVVAWNRWNNGIAYASHLTLFLG